MQTTYDAIYLSPHLDDAALSCGGQIFTRTQAGEHVLIVTVMAGSPDLAVDSPYVAALHSRWELAGDAAAQRRAEDEEACRILGADFLHLGIPDCIYRLDPLTGAPLYVSDDDIFGEIHPAEYSLEDTLAAQLRQLPPTRQWVAPLTIGHHVDHLFVRATAEKVVGANLLLYYEDYPYAQKPGYLERILDAERTGWEAVTYPVSAAARQAKVAAILAFRSQMSTFFRDQADLEAQVGSYMELVSGERCWRKSAI